MSGDWHFGDEVTQYGDHNVGMIKNQGPADPQAAFRDMIRAVQVLRGQVSPADRAVIDASMTAIGTGGNVEKGTLRRALDATMDAALSHRRGGISETPGVLPVASAGSDGRARPVHHHRPGAASG